MTPGIGAPPTGSELRKVTNHILTCLDKELVEEAFSNVTQELYMPMPSMDVHSLKALVKDMSSVKFWQQKGI